jgi:hypothetical protein
MLAPDPDEPGLDEAISFAAPSGHVFDASHAARAHSKFTLKWTASAARTCPVVSVRIDSGTSHWS